MNVIAAVFLLLAFVFFFMGIRIIYNTLRKKKAGIEAGETQPLSEVPAVAETTKTTETPVEKAGAVKAVFWLVVIVGVVYLLLVIFVPLFNAAVYAWDPTETFSDNQLHNKGYDIRGNCVVKEGALFINGKCEIKRDVVDRVPYVMFDIMNGRGNIITVLRDKHPEVGSRNIVFGPTGVVTTRREIYLAQTRWIISDLAYYPEVQIGKKRLIYNRPSYHKDPRDYTIEIKFNGRFIVDNIESPGSSIEWKLNPFY